MEDIEAAIRNFLDEKNSDQKSLLIRGDWGTGKTHLVKRMLQSMRSDRHMFVSLYGVKSREDLDLAVAARAIAHAPKKKFFADQSGHVGELLRLFNIERLAAHVAKETIKSRVVCFDDIERKANEYPIQDVIAYVDILNNTYGAKTICIVNTDRLSQTEQDWLRENAEKTFNKRLRLEPTTTHVREIAVGSVDVFDDLIANLLATLNVKNIRIAIEIAQNCRAFIRAMSEDKRTLNNSELSNRLATVAAATASLSGLSGFPSPTFFRETMDAGAFDISAEADDDDDSWRSVLSSLGYKVTDSFDHMIIDQLDRGYFSNNEIADHFERQANGFAKSDKDKYSTAWREYHDSTNTDTAGFVQRFFEGAMEGVASIEIQNMNASIRLLNLLGEHAKALELAELYAAAQRKRGPYFVDIKADAFLSGSDVDATFEAVMNRALAAEIAGLEPTVILEEAATRESIGDYQASRLATMSATDLRSAISIIPETKRWPAIKACLTAARADPGNERRSTIQRITKDALKAMAEGSVLNRVRIERKFGLKFIEEPQDS